MSQWPVLYVDCELKITNKIICDYFAILVLFCQTHDHSICIRPDLPSFTVKPQTAVFHLAGNLVSMIFVVLFSPGWSVVLYFFDWILMTQRYSRFNIELLVYMLPCKLQNFVDGQWSYTVQHFAGIHTFMWPQSIKQKSAKLYHKFSVYSRRFEISVLLHFVEFDRIDSFKLTRWSFFYPFLTMDEIFVLFSECYSTAICLEKSSALWWYSVHTVWKTVSDGGNLYNPAEETLNWNMTWCAL